MKDQVLELRLYDTKLKRYLDIYKDQEILMEEAGLDPRLGIDDFGVLGDTCIIVLDRCGNYGYLGAVRFKVIINSEI